MKKFLLGSLIASLVVSFLLSLLGIRIPFFFVPIPLLPIYFYKRKKPVIKDIIGVKRIEDIFRRKHG